MEIPKTAPLGKAGWGITYFIADTLSFDALARTLLAWRAYVPIPVSCVRAKQIRRHPTIYLYERRILLL
nr:MAG TPA: hypothetical protein [Caudoviricetes sp.]